MPATPKIDAHMTLAYVRWLKPDNDWSKQDFCDQLSAPERVAFFAGNLAAQVNNGGFMQWHDNGYATPEALGFLERLCVRLDTETTGYVLELLKRFRPAQVDFVNEVNCGHWDDSDARYAAFETACDKLDCIFYDIDGDAFLADVEASL